MKVKVIAGIVGIFVAAGAIFLLHTLVPVIILAGFAGIGAYELLKSLKVKSKRLTAISVLFAAAVPFLAAYYSSLPSQLIGVLTVLPFLIFLLVMLSDFRKISLVQTLAGLAGGVLIPLGLSSLVLLRDLRPVYDIEQVEYNEKWNLFWVIFGLLCCWSTDIFAYLVGKATGGKHKMSPNVSPNKSWEGAIGGVVITALLNGALWFLFSKFEWFGGFEPPLYFVLLLSPVLSVLGILGDLTFSAIKRQSDIKDFGNLIPGHGGALDRFDSYLFVFPTLWAVLWSLYT
ncbi:MAG: phosphatidate cytidylyltransferase [Clostridium sp.]|jgi:phosphatidate cytidylyltransferase|nr:phosphatidate cytidylyltransferase [Clostridium sp.]